MQVSLDRRLRLGCKRFLEFLENTLPIVHSFKLLQTLLQIHVSLGRLGKMITTVRYIHGQAKASSA
jgi:hypothetical protein